MLEINKTLDGTTLNISLAGRVDATNSPQLQEAVNESLEQAQKAVFDFERLTYISSAGLRVLLATQKALGTPGAVVVKNAPDSVKEVIRVTGLGDFVITE